MAAARRSILLAWQSAAIDTATSACVPADGASIASAICWLVPHEQVLTEMLRTLWAALLREKSAASYGLMPSYDAYVTASLCRLLALLVTLCYHYCRAIVRWDVTFRVQAGAHASIGSRARTKVSSGVLTITGGPRAAVMVFV